MHKDPQREAIRQLILLQEEILLAGGFSADSSKYAAYMRLRWEVVGLFGLPPSRKFVKLLIQYPFTVAVKRSKPVQETVADYYRCKWFGADFLNGSLARDYHLECTLDSKVEFLHWKLTQAAENLY